MKRLTIIITAAAALLLLGFPSTASVNGSLTPAAVRQLVNSTAPMTNTPGQPGAWLNPHGVKKSFG